MLKSFGNEEREGGIYVRLPLLIQPFLKEVEMIGMRFRRANGIIPDVLGNQK